MLSASPNPRRRGRDRRRIEAATGRDRDARGVARRRNNGEVEKLPRPLDIVFVARIRLRLCRGRVSSIADGADAVAIEGRERSGHDPFDAAIERVSLVAIVESDELRQC